VMTSKFVKKVSACNAGTYHFVEKAHNFTMKKALQKRKNVVI